MKLNSLILVILCVAAANLRTLAAFDAFLKIEGVDGESSDRAHAGQIELLAWNFEMSNTPSVVGGGAGAGKVSVHDLTVTKSLDKATANLMKACATGEHIKEAVLYVRKAGDKPQEYFKVTFKDVLITSVSISGSGGNDRPTESLSLNFASFKVEYIEPGPKGKNPATSFEWDLSQNRAN